MYDPKGSNQKQMQKMVSAIREKREQLEQQQKDIETMLADLQDWEGRYLAELDNIQRASSSN